MPLAAHTAGIGASDRASVSNFVFNQIGHFAAAGGALAKSLFLGGVTERFPRMRLALLEGGAAVGVETYIGLVSGWQKRGGGAIAGLNPENLDKDLLVGYSDLELISPGHPLFEGVVERVLKDYGHSLRQGAVFYNADAVEPTVLWLLKCGVEDGRAGGRGAVGVCGGGRAGEPGVGVVGAAAGRRGAGRLAGDAGSGAGCRVSGPVGGVGGLAEGERGRLVPAAACGRRV